MADWSPNHSSQWGGPTSQSAALRYPDGRQHANVCTFMYSTNISSPPAKEWALVGGGAGNAGAKQVNNCEMISDTVSV